MAGGGAHASPSGWASPRATASGASTRAQRACAAAARDLMPVDEMAMQGLHNAANALAAHALLRRTRRCRASRWPGRMREFKGLPHRVELVAEANGVRFYDDSKGTNVGATVAALEGFRDPVVLIAGGDGKGQDFSPLAPAVKARARAVVLIGRDAPRDRRRRSPTPACRSQRAASMEEAVRHGARAREARRRGAALARRAPASTCSATTATAATCSRPRARDRASVRLMLYQPRAARARASTRRCSGRRCCSPRIGLVMVYSASIAMAEAERFTGFRSELLPRRATRSTSPSASPSRPRSSACRCGCGRRPRRGSSCWARCCSSAVLIPGIGREVNGSRRWIPLRPRHLPALGADEALRRALRRRLHGAQGRVHGRLPQGLPADVRGDDADRRTPAARARLRRPGRDHHDRDGDPLPRRAQLAALRRAWRRCSRSRSWC